MKIEIINIADLKPLEKNVRRHNQKQIAELIRSLDQFGQTRAIIVDEENNILIGNGLYMAMTQRGDTTAQCSRVLGLNETEKKKLVLTDNKVYSLGTDDYGMIEEFINDITFDGDFDIAGFDEDILKAMTRTSEEIANDVANYGIVDKREIPTENEISTPVVQTAEAAVAPVPAPVQQTAQNVQPMQQAEVKTERTIICPSCGEVIHLD